MSNRIVLPSLAIGPAKEIIRTRFPIDRSAAAVAC